MSSLILLDGDLPGLVALAVTTERVALDQGVSPRAMFDPSLDGDPSRVAAAKAQAARFDVELIASPSLTPTDVSGGLRRTRSLLLAGVMATKHDLASVHWPIWACRADIAGGDRAEAIATELDRVELASRLLGLDADVLVEAPYVDLDHAPIADLAVDMDVPATETWWGSHAAAMVEREAAAERDRWLPALEEAGWRGRLEPVTG